LSNSQTFTHRHRHWFGQTKTELDVKRIYGIYPQLEVGGEVAVVVFWFDLWVAQRNIKENEASKAKNK
jgi:hypothetical protein